MEQAVLKIFEESGWFALWFSIGLSILISIAGIVPSVFVTAANITYFGFTKGLIISIAGEALGAIISFYLYRKGLKRVNFHSKNKTVVRLQSAKGVEAFLLIIALRIFPFIPSGIVTFAGAGSKMGIINFSIASTIGKIPALLIEAYSVKQVLSWDWQGKLILAISAIVILIVIFFKKQTKNNL
ncbi:TVP38/TMEM64 family protein [Peribacillus tepidiphilus]|jgi:uncharacterized membrane protein YdjX (TVP38/TMEM64 family)|uniref:TVP38/TMEM64 family protein n=1 Tax=Peribacillus tepidiphilus TaxID=2652445 RepID=UPI0035B4FBF7